MKKTAVFLVFLLILDAVSKKLASTLIQPILLYPFQYPFGGVPIFETPWITCSLNYVINTGAAWGVLSGYASLLFKIRFVIILGLIVHLFFSRQEIWAKRALGLVLTGAVGNMIDYLLYGHVIDFIHFTIQKWSFPIFNFADSYITLGILAYFFLIPKKKRQPA